MVPHRSHRLVSSSWALGTASCCSGWGHGSCPHAGPGQSPDFISRAAEGLSSSSPGLYFSGGPVNESHHPSSLLFPVLPRQRRLLLQPPATGSQGCAGTNWGLIPPQRLLKCHTRALWSGTIEAFPALGQRQMLPWGGAGQAACGPAWRMAVTARLVPLAHNWAALVKSLRAEPRDKALPPTPGTGFRVRNVAGHGGPSPTW